MVDIFNLFITISIVLIILIIYRQFDKNNRSLEKVKKYSDMIKKNIEGFIDDKSTEIKDLAIELQVNLKSGKEILNRMKTIEEDFKDRAGKIDGFQQYIDKYNLNINELMDMTVNVEENLQRIRKESGFIDNIDKKIKDALYKLSQINKNIPDIQNQIKKKNQEQLSIIVENMNSKIDKISQNVSNQIASAERKVKDFSVYITRLESRRDNLENETIKRIKKMFEEFILKAKESRHKILDSLNIKMNEVFKASEDKKQNIINELNKAIQISNNKMELIVESLEEKKDSIVTDVNELVDISNTKVAETKETLSVKLHEFESDLTKIEYNYKIRLESAAEQAEILEHEAFLKIKEIIERNYRELNSDIELKYMELEEKLKFNRKEIEELFGSARSDATVWKTEISKSFKDAENNFYNGFDKIGDDITLFKNNFQKELEKTKVESHTYQKDVIKVLKDRLEIEKQEIQRNLGIMSQNLNKIRPIEQEIKYLIEKYEKDMNTVEVKIINRIETFTEKYSEQIDLAAQDVEIKVIDGVEKRLEEFEENSIYRINKIEQMNSDVDSMKNNVKAYMDKISENLKASFDSNMVELVSKSDNSKLKLEEVMNSIRDEIVELESELQELKAKAYQDVSDKLKGFEEEFMNDLSVQKTDMYNNLEEWKSDINIKIDGFANTYLNEREKVESMYNEEMEKLINDFNEKSSRMEEKVFLMNEKIIEDVEKKHKLLNEKLGEIEKQQKNFVEQTKLFERADKFKTDLEHSIDELQNNLIILDPQKKEMKEIQKEFNNTKNLAGEVSGKLSKFLSEKRRIENLERNFEKLIDVSETVEQRLEKLSKSDDVLKVLQIKLGDLEDLREEVDSKFSVLEDKEKLVSATINGVKKNFLVLEEMETKIKGISIDLKRLPPQLTGMSEKIVYLSNNKERADIAIEKMEIIDNILKDVEVRMENLQSAREWLANTETRLQSLNKETQEQVKLMKMLYKTEGIKKEKGAPKMDKRQTVIKLAHQGWNAQEIARATSISRGEVELILELAPQK